MPSTAHPEPTAAELGLFRASQGRHLPRNRRGQFVAVRRSAIHTRIIRTTRMMREQLNLPPLAVLQPMGDEE